MSEDRGANFSGQERIWSHFQNRQSESFDAATPRLRKLIRWVCSDWKGNRPANVLNIGIGNGFLERYAVERGFKVASLDPDTEAISRLAALGIDARVGYAEAMPFDGRTFDYVIASEVLEHLSASQRAVALAEIARVLSASGCLLVTVPYQENLALNEVICPDCGKLFHRWGHQKSFTRQSLSDELRVHFPRVEVCRTAFIEFDRSFGRNVKSLLRWLLARCGQMIAVPSILAICRKSSVKAATASIGSEENSSERPDASRR